MKGKIRRGAGLGGLILAAVFLAAFPAGAQTCLPYPSGLVSWWAGDGDPEDPLGGNTGTLKNGASFAAGRMAQAFYLPRSSYVEVPHSPSLNPAQAITVEAWINPLSLNPNSFPAIVKKADSNAGYGLEFQHNSSNLLFWVRIGSSWVASPPGPVSVGPNAWSHVAAVYDGTWIRMYVNGVERGSPTHRPGTINQSGHPLNIGRDPSNPNESIRFFDGLVDEVRVYNRALSAQEIQAIYLNGICKSYLPPPCLEIPDGLVGWWPGDGHAGDPIEGNHGLRKNGAAFAAGKAGQSFDLQGTAYIEVPDSPVLNPARAITVEAWINPLSLAPNSSPAIVKKAGGSSGYALEFDHNRPNVLFRVHDGSFWVSSPAAPVSVGTNTWSHVAAVYDGTWAQMYVNGVEAGPPAYGPGAITPSNLPLNIGRDPSAPNDSLRYFSGRIDEVRIYDRALSAEEIQDIHFAGICKVYPPLHCTGASTGLASWWAGDGNGQDSTAGNHGTLKNGAAFAPGKVGQAFDLPGTSYVEVPDSPVLNPTQAITVEAWINPAFLAPGSYPSIVKKAGSYSGYGLEFQYNQPKVMLWLNFGSSWAASPAAPVSVGTNTWSHLAAVYDGTWIRMYVNGAEVGPATYRPGTINPSFNPLNIGRDPSNPNETARYFDGMVDEVRIYNRPLSAEEITAIYLAGSSGVCRNTPPLAVCQDVSVSAGPTCTADASVDKGSYDPQGLPIALVQSPAGPFGLGATPVTLTVTNSLGFTGQCAATVTVTENTPPSVMAPPAVSLPTGPEAAACGMIINDSQLGQAFANDNCPGVTVSASGVPAGNLFPIGTTPITYTATDASGFTASATQAVTVADNTPPVITPPPALTVYTGAGAASCGVHLPDAQLGQAAANDNCSGATVTRSGVPAGNIFPVGNTTITYTARDAAGNEASATQVVTVIDNTPPTVLPPSNFSVFTGPGSTACGAVVSDAQLAQAVTSDNCPGVTVTRSGVPANNLFPAGATTVTYTANDAAGNSTTVTQIVTVADNTPPVVVAPLGIALSTGSGAPACGATATEEQLGQASMIDNCPGVVLSRSGVPANNLFPTGATTVTYTATDASGNTATATQTVTVTDNTPPTITAPAGLSRSTGPGSTSAGLTIPDADLGAAAATDNCSGVSVVRTGVPAGNFFPVGATTVTYTATDASGNTASAAQTVTVTDNTPPAITAPASITASSAPGSCGLVIPDAQLGTASASDNAPGVTVSRSGVPAGNLFPVGATTITYTATDASGNTATATQTVTVTDNTPPTITAPAGLSRSTGPGSTSAGLTIPDADLGAAAATDNCSGVSVVRTGVPAGNFFPVGATTVTYTATDAFGNSASAAQQVIVTRETGNKPFSLDVFPKELWPPNNKMVDVRLLYNPAPSAGNVCKVVHVSSNESLKPGDYEIVSPQHLRLRASRAGNGKGRVYTIAVTCGNPGTNPETKTATVIVPHDQGK